MSDLQKVGPSELATAVPQVRLTDAIPQGAIRLIPFRFAVVIPVHGLKVRSLHELRVGQVIATACSTAEYVPVHVGETVLGSAELDNVDGVMAFRITRLS